MSGETCGWAPCETCAALTRFMEKRAAGELIDRLAVTSTWWESEEADRFYARGTNLPPCDHGEAPWPSPESPLSPEAEGDQP